MPEVSINRYHPSRDEDPKDQENQGPGEFGYAVREHSKYGPFSDKVTLFLGVPMGDHYVLLRGRLVENRGDVEEEKPILIGEISISSRELARRTLHKMAADFAHQLPGSRIVNDSALALV